MDDRPNTLPTPAARVAPDGVAPNAAPRAGGVEARAPAPVPPPAAVPPPAPPPDPPSAEAPAPPRRPASAGLPARLARRALKLGATALIFAAAAIAALLIWDYYVAAPWTRDGRVRVQVANVAPQVSGQITEVRIVDDQYVRKGDVLYVIDPSDFQTALQTAKATVQGRAADFQVKREQAERRQRLTNLATTPEQQQQYAGQATQAQAAFQAAQADEAQAEINLKRTQVTSPVNGFVTNLLMRVGDFAHAGTSDVSVIDADSYWVDGYFEETKMAQVCVGDAAEAALMGYAQPLLGHVQSVTRGISVSNAASSTQGLPNVDAVYTWVRLAQRVPVRMKIDRVPPGVPLVSGMTATVSVRPAAATGAAEAANAPPGPWWRAKLDGVAASLHRLVDPPAPRPGCVPAVGDTQGRTVTLPTPEPTPALRPDQINPGLTPGMADAPRPR